MRLGLHALAEQHAEMHWCRVVDLSQLEGKVRVVPGPLRIAEQAEGDHGDVDVAAGEGQLDGRRVRFMITRIKIDFGDLAAEVGELGRRRRTPVARPGGKHDPQSGTCIPCGRSPKRCRRCRRAAAATAVRQPH